MPGEPRPNSERAKTKTTTISTSFVAETSEVAAMVNVTRNRNWPIFWYELVQGALDYNDYRKGLPSVICIQEDKERVPLQEYINNPSARKIVRIEVRNFVSGESGLTPDNVALVAHKGGEGTLGQHGRGLTVGSTACLVGGLCEGISYSSIDRHGPWFGKGLMVKTRPDQVDANFALEYQRGAGLADPEETVIAVDSPSEQFLKTLRLLPWGFLLANPQYQFSRLAGTERAKKVSNIFTIYANSHSGIVPSSSVDLFSEEEIKAFGIKDFQYPSSAQLPRVEILPDSLARRDASGNPTNTIFSGGIRLQGYRPYALNWSFYGFDEADYSFRVGRGNDSIRSSGDPIGLITAALKKCDSPDIFLPILRASVGSNKCAESGVDTQVFTNLKPGVETAIKTAWTTLVEEMGFSGEEVYMTTSARLRDRAEAEGYKVVMLNSQAFAEVLTKDGYVKSVEDAFGVKKTSEDTGEMIRLNRLQEGVHIDYAASSLLRGLAFSNARVVTNEPGRLRLVLGSEAMSRFRGEFYELDTSVVDFAKDFLAGTGGHSRCEIIADDGEKGIVFEFSQSNSRQAETGSRVEIAIKRGEVISSGNKSVRVNLSAIGESVPFQDFQNQFNHRLVNLVDSSGRVSLERYLEQHRESGDVMEMILRRRIAEQQALAHGIEKTLAQLGRGKSSEGSRVMFGKGSVFDANGVSIHRDLLDVISSPPEDQSSLVHLLRTTLKRYCSPDVALNLGSRPGFIEYFVESIEAPYSDVSLSNYLNAADVAYGKQSGSKTITVNSSLPSGTYPIFGLIGHRPIGYNTRDNTHVSFLELPGKNLWAISSDQPIPSGLEIYFSKNNSPDISTPDSKEAGELVKREKLAPHWQNLVNALREDPNLSGKQRVDILLKAWGKAFTYNSNFDYLDSDNDKLASIVNGAEGVCAESARGFLALCRAAGIPSRLVVGRMTKFGRLVNGEDEHAFNQVFIDGNWIMVEPQGGVLNGYLDGGYKKAEKIDKEYQRLIKDIPKRKYLLRESLIMTKKTLALTSPLIAVMAAIDYIVPRLLTLSGVTLPHINSPLSGIFGTSGTARYGYTEPASPNHPLINLPGFEFPSLNPFENPQLFVIAILLGAIPAAMKLAEIRTQRHIGDQLEKNLESIRIEQEKKEANESESI